MKENRDAGNLPGWTLLVSLLGSATALMILWACRYFGLSWWIGVSAAIAVVVAGIFGDRAIDFKYRSTQRTN